jgi:NAD(P)H-dependent FMN reductase
MSRVIGIAGSTRRGSFNGSLLRAAAELAPSELEVEMASIAGIPLYDGDLEREQGVPSAVSELKDRIASADGLLLVTPEYNNSIPGTFKNAIDWLTRPPKDIPRVFGDKPVALMGATPGRGGTRMAQAAWLPVFRTLGAQLWAGGQMYVASAGQTFDADGQLTDATVRESLQKFLSGFARFVQASRESRH